MNGIKKAFSTSSRRRSSGNDSVGSGASDEFARNNAAVDSPNTTPETSPRTNTNKKLDNNTTTTPLAAAGTGAAPAGTTAATKSAGSGSAVQTSASKKAADELEANQAGLPSKGHSANVDPKALRAVGDGQITESKHHIAHRTEDTHHRHHTEEVFRERDLHHHQNHVQLHAVPVYDQEHQSEKLLDSKRHAITNIHEKRASSQQDAKLLADVGAHHDKGDLTKSGTQSHEIVDRGEKVRENVHHHVHHVVQPVVMKDTHEYTRAQTYIPTNHHIEHAPVVHQLIEHEPVSKDEYLKSGGMLGAPTNKTHDLGLLHGAPSTRKVEGVAERLEKELKLQPGQAI